MQALDKNILDALDKIVVKLSLCKEDITNLSESSQCFTVI